MRNSLLLVVLLLLNLSCDKEPSTSPEEVLIPKYLLFVDSNPPGSKIYVDNRNSGQFTPDTIKWLEEGNHLITLKSYVFKDSNIVVNIDGNFNSVMFDYTTNPTMLGHFYFDSDPLGAEIILDDSNTALITPATIKNLFPGEHKITYKKTGFWDATFKAKIVGDRTITAYKYLIDTTVWINFRPDNVNLPTLEFNDLTLQVDYIKWFASEGSGLIRYDDNEWTVFNTSNSSIPSNNVKAVRAAGNKIWIGTDKGAAVLSNGIFTVYNSSNSPLPDKIKCISPAPDGTVWIGSVSDGLFHFDGINWTHYNEENSPLGTDWILAIHVDENNIKWIGTLGGGLLIFDGTNWSKAYNAIPSPAVSAVHVYNGKVVIGCSLHSFMFWNGFKWETKMRNGGLAELNPYWISYRQAGTDIVAVAIDDNGDYWFSDRFSAAGKKSTAGWTRYPQFLRVNAITIDKANNKWLTSEIYGIYKYKGN